MQRGSESEFCREPVLRTNTGIVSFIHTPGLRRVCNVAYYRACLLFVTKGYRSCGGRAYIKTRDEQRLGKEAGWYLWEQDGL